MARIFTTSTGEQAAKAWFHDIMLAAGILTQSQRSGGDLGSRVTSSSSFRDAAMTVKDEIVNRDFADIDSALSTLSSYYYYPDMSGNGRQKSPKPEVLAKYIAYMADTLQLYWDDLNRTPYEITAFQKTILGAAVYQYGLTVSAKAAAPAKKVKSASASSGASTRVAGQPPQNNYKQSGPQSGNVRDLQGQPGQKVLASASGDKIYRIIGVNANSKNIPNAFIKPLSSGGAAGSTNKVFFGSGNGYTDCTCYFDDEKDAQAFAQKCLTIIPPNITNIRVVEKTADPNGYFLVGTEFGMVAVSARTLNEALTEGVEIEENLEETCWDRATKNMSESELTELYQWMQKD